MIYLYITPSGSVNLIEGDKMPKEPTYGKWCHDDKNNLEKSLAYESAIQSAKASSVPVDDQERALYTIFNIWREQPKIEDPMPFGAWKCNAMKKDHFYGPFDIGYEIDHRCTYLQTDGKCDDCFRNNLCAKVAILLPEKELVKQELSDDLLIEMEDVRSGDGAYFHASVYDNSVIVIEKWDDKKSKVRNYKITDGEPVGNLEEKETPEQFYARGRYPEMKDKFDKSAARFSYDDMMQFANNYIEAIRRGSL